MASQKKMKERPDRKEYNMRVIIIGLGRMGTSLSLHLMKKGHQVTAIDTDPEAFDRLGKSFNGTKIIGFGFDRDVLGKARIEQTDAVVACTESDEINAVVARVAKNIYRVPRVIARLYDARKAEIYRRLGIQTLSTTAWGVERATEILTYSQLDSVYEMGNGSVNLVRIEVPALMIGRKIKDLTVIGEINVISVSRNNKTFLPTLGTILEADDILYLAVNYTATDKLKAMLDLT